MSIDLPAPTRSALPGYTEADWRDAVDQVLKGGPFEKLRSSTADGITIEPLYRRVPNASPVVGRRGAAPWGILQRIDHPNINDANRLSLLDLGGGATGLDLVFASSPHARGYGIALPSRADIAKLLDSVLLDLISLRVDAGALSQSIGKMIFDQAISVGLEPARLDLSLVVDPIGEAVREGGSNAPLKAEVATVGETAASLITGGFPGLLVNVDGRVWHEAGASRTQTLAAMLATAVTYWRALEAAGLSAEIAASRIGFTVAVDQGQFSAMAEIRALRLLWSRAAEAAGLPPAIAHVHAETSFRMMSRLDANTNMIRTTIAAFAAGVGGADSLSVLPYNSANGLADEFARRLARNTQHILIEEANLARVADPATGAGRIEAETRELAQVAWDLFREIEAEGGIIASLQAGHPQARIAASADALKRDVARRKVPVTGVSEYPLSNEPAVTVLNLAPISAKPKTYANPLRRLTDLRLSQPFEQLRASAVAAAPTVFLLPLGDPVDFSSRVNWVTNLFEVGGVAVTSGRGGAELDDPVAAFKASGSKAVCIVGTDAIYTARALDVIRVLKAGGAEAIFLAGRPGDENQEDSLRAAGLDMFLQAGQDVVSVLADAHALIASTG